MSTEQASENIFTYLGQIGHFAPEMVCPPKSPKKSKKNRTLLKNPRKS